MKWLLVSICFLMLISPVLAGSDTFTIETLYGSPTHYTIDYGQYETANVYNYYINSTTTLVANQSWLLLGSNNFEAISELDTRTGIAFTADLLQNFTVTTPDNYRYYYLVMLGGFYDPTTVLTLDLFATKITTPSPYVTTSPPAPYSIPMFPAAKKDSAPVQFVQDWMVWIIIILLVIVGYVVIKRR